MYIIIAGGGMVGGGLLRMLLDNKHDVVLIEQDKETCDRLYAETGVIAINASATNIEALNEAGREEDLSEYFEYSTYYSLEIGKFRYPIILVSSQNHHSC